MLYLLMVHPLSESLPAIYTTSLFSSRGPKKLGIFWWLCPTSLAAFGSQCISDFLEILTLNSGDVGRMEGGSGSSKLWILHMLPFLDTHHA